MSEAPASPPASRLATPSWLDTRLVLGVLLVLVSVVVGARVLASADDAQGVWVATRDLAAGSTLADGDLTRGQVRLFDNGGRYLTATAPPPVGYVLTREVGADELLPVASVALPERAGRVLRDVSVPVEAGRLPADLAGGELVDVHVTAPLDSGAGPPPSAAPSSAPSAPASGAAPGTSTLLLAAVPVRSRSGSAGAGPTGEQAVVLTVDDAQVAELVAGLRTGQVDLVRVRRDSGLPTLPGSASAAG